MSAGTRSPSTAHHERTTSSPTAQEATSSARATSKGWRGTGSMVARPITSRIRVLHEDDEGPGREAGPFVVLSVSGRSVVPAGELLAERLQRLVGGQRTAGLVAGLDLVGRAG